MIADEVVARSDVYHIKNKLKALITGYSIRINPKNSRLLGSATTSTWSSSPTRPCRWCWKRMTAATA